MVQSSGSEYCADISWSESGGKVVSFEGRVGEDLLEGSEADVQAENGGREECWNRKAKKRGLVLLRRNVS